MWRWLLARCLGQAEREFVLGDLDEEYARLAGGSAARRWYRSQAIRSSAVALRDRFSPGGPGTSPGGRRANPMDRLTADIRFALRSLRRSPALATLVIATLGAGSGAAIAIFTATNEVLFSALTYEDPDELVMLWESNRERGWEQVEAAPANVADWRERAASFEDVAHYSPFRRGVALVQSDAAHHVSVGPVSGNLFDVLGVRPAMGRVFTDEETWADADPVVVLSHEAWQRYFSGDREILGRTIDLDGTSYTVIGVMPHWFEYEFADAELWTTMRWTASRAASVWFRQAHVVRAVARLRDGATVEQARAELAAVAIQLQEENRDLNAGMEAGLTPLKAFLVQEQRTPLLLLLGAVGLLMLIAVANVANLLLVRSTGRVREIAVRASLGASRRRVVQQLLTESGILAAAGTAAGLVVAWLALRLVRTFGGEGLPPLDLVPDPFLVTFVIVLGAGSALLFGLAPALRASRVDLRGTLAESSRTGTRGRRGIDASNLIVMAQVALAVMLAAAAGLTFRSLAGLGTVAEGVPTANILTFQVAPPSGSYDDAGRARFATELRRRLSTVPGVVEAGVGRGFPLAGYAWSSDFAIRGWPAERFGSEVLHREALPGYFTTMGVEVLEGEMFPEVPAPDRQVPVVVNRAFAERYFPDSSPVGRFLANDREPTGNSYWYEIVAVVENERMAVHEEPVPEIIAHISGDVPGTLSVVVRTGVAPLSMVDAMRAAVRELDPGIPLMNVRTMDTIRDAALARERLLFTVFGVLAACALVLACVGIYGVASQAARSRDREVGIRVALGATRGIIVRQFVGSGIPWIAAGLTLGVAGALSAGRVVESVLWGVTASDATTLFVVAFVLAGSGLLASFVPARRASIRDPAAVLRDEG
jgi:predicted permease